MVSTREAPRRAGVASVALAVVVLLLLSTSTLSARLQGDKQPAVVLDRSTPQPTPTAPPPVIPEAVTPAPAGTPIPVAELPTAAPSESPFVEVAETTRASVVVSVGDADQEQTARELLGGLDGVVTVAAVDVAEVDVGGVPTTVAAVDPDEFRHLVPEETANHQPLWERLAAGDLALTHEFGQTHDVPLGRDVAVGPAATPVRAGAFATNGTPPVADGILHRDHAQALGGRTQRRLLVGLAREASPTATTEALVDAGLDAEEIPDPRLPDDDVIIPQGGITPENVWDHLALCESSGNWQINTGNGYYGGLQFLPESWAAVGGQGLPHEWPREEQIYRAVLLWQIQGWEAWPQCARKLGLIVDPPPSPTPGEEG